MSGLVAVRLVLVKALVSDSCGYFSFLASGYSCFRLYNRGRIICLVAVTINVRVRNMFNGVK